jgi:hypothetical protein
MLILWFSGLSGQGADDVASVISNFLEGLGSAAGITLDDAAARHQGFSPEFPRAAASAASHGIDRRSESFPTQGEDILFVDSLFQADDE